MTIDIASTVKPSSENIAANLQPTEFAPAFDTHIDMNGYIWWYLDAISADNEYGITIIAMLGNVFSPYYAKARRRQPADPLHYCALNVCLYGKTKRWAMTERGRTHLQRSATQLSIGPSNLSWENDELIININEVATPFPSRVRGQVRVVPIAKTHQDFKLEPEGRHIWRPIFPFAKVIVELEHPNLNWQGNGYLDSNRGYEPLEARFRKWDWSRTELHNGTAMLYDLDTLDGKNIKLSLFADQQGNITAFDPPPRKPLPTSRIWRVNRRTQCAPGFQASVMQTLEDTPFYTRSMVATQLMGEHGRGIHESVSLERFKAGWVQMLLPWRMPRVS